MVKMDLATSQTQASSTETMTSSHIQSYNDLIKSLATLSSASELKGKAYESAKSYADTVILPLLQGGILLSEEISTAMSKLPDDYSSQVAPESLDSDILDQQIQTYQSAYDRASDIYDRVTASDTIDMKSASNLSRTMSINQTKIKELKEKRDKLIAFNGKSSSIFSEIANLKQAVEQGLALINQGFTNFNGEFSLPSSTQLQWTQTIGKAWKTYQTAQATKASFNNDVCQIAKDLGITPQEVLDYILIGKEPNKYIKIGQKLVHSSIKTYKGIKFLNGKPVSIDDKGRIRWGDGFLYKKDTQHMYGNAKELKKATEIDISKTSYGRTSTGDLDFKEMGRMSKDQFKESINPLNDFKGWKDASKLSKFGKGLGIAGTGLTILGNFDSNFVDKPGGIHSGKNWGNFGVDMGVDLGTSAGAAAIGAGVGSLFLPPLGTVVGAGVGIGISFLANHDWDKNDNKSSLTDKIKSGLKGLFN
ncbi:T7SS effector LXG polymorphic toxin [Streptococcus parauberis]|uniref:T7SS effector LXG polymorphic toxin n=1 Tax=Streptococcus parauberis TaxID=1348 RepID=UPI00378F5085